MIVFVTAEPFGAYHLAPFAGPLRNEAIHLIPYPQPVQGPQLFTTTADLSTLENASLLVITGGDLTAWTEAIAWQAHRHNVPIIFSETAYPSGTPLGRPTPPFTLITASSPHSQTLYATHFNTNPNNILMLGHPLLDGIDQVPALDTRTPGSPARILILSTADQLPDTYKALREAADLATAAGHYITVRPHPRENTHPWESPGYHLTHNTGPNGLLQDLAETDLVIGIPGTAYLAAAATNRPIITISTTSSTPNANPGTPGYQNLSTTITPEQLLTTIPTATPADPTLITTFTGPLGNSVNRHILLWKSVL